jgi:hypothetical protein
LFNQIGKTPHNGSPLARSKATPNTVFVCGGSGGDGEINIFLVTGDGFYQRFASRWIDNGTTPAVNGIKVSTINKQSCFNV